MLPPKPWDQVAVIRVGGLVAVGFSPKTDLLLVISHNGTSVIDCQTGRKIGRDPTLNYPDQTNMCRGISPLMDTCIPVAGLWGGSLPTHTKDDWHITSRTVRDSISLHLSKDSTSVQIADDAVVEIRAFGFSPTERSLIVATAADLLILGRNGTNEEDNLEIELQRAAAAVFQTLDEKEERPRK